jgi:preprotein translocase subunit SecG
MITVLLVLQAFVTLALIGVVLIQRSEGGGLGLGSSQGMGNFMTGRGTASLLTRTTAVLATAFMALSLILALLYKNGGTSSGESILNGPVPATSAPATSVPASTKTPTAPATPLPLVPGETPTPAPSPTPTPAPTPAPAKN